MNALSPIHPAGAEPASRQLPGAADLLASVQERLQPQVAPMLRPRPVPSGQVLTLAGDVDPPVLALQSGSVMLASGDSAEDAGPIDMLTGPVWLQLGGPDGRAIATVTARADCRVAVIPLSRLRACGTGHDDLVRWTSTIGSALLRRMMAAMSDSLIPDCERRCAAALLRLAPPDQSIVPVAQGELAMLCGISRDSVGRALRNFESAGLIRIGYRRILLVDAPGLGRVRNGQPLGAAA